MRRPLPVPSRHSISSRINYYRRIFDAYLTSKPSHLNFWHEAPEANPRLTPDVLGDYYMTFRDKAEYAGHRDATGIPMLDYRGAVGVQYNPIAIAQYGLGNYNLWRMKHDTFRRDRFLCAADWLVENLETNSEGLWVWNHHFDWEYRTVLRAPWYSALSQGQGISLLVRAHAETDKDVYLQAARRAFESFLRPTSDGGVTSTDDSGGVWFEETIVDPPTHILNGFIWASWGLYDLELHTGDVDAARLFKEAVQTLRENLHQFDTGFWSLYELSGTRLKMLASPFYHQLHIVQLHVMHRLTGEAVFDKYATRWEAYQRHPVKRRLALAHKALFKLLYY